MRQLCLLGLLICSCTAIAQAADGLTIGCRADGSGIFPADAKPVREWNAQSGKNIVWKTPLPNHGNGSPIVVGKRAFVVCEPGWPAGVDVPTLLCIDADTGKELWTAALDPAPTLPADIRSQHVALRTSYWESVRKWNTLHYQAVSGDTAAQAAFQKRTGKKFKPHTGTALMDLDKVSFSSTPKAERKKWAALTGNKKEKYNFYLPSWRWTGMGISMLTPVSDGKHVYVFNGWGFVCAYDMNGKQLWMTNLREHILMTGSNYTESCGNWPLIIDGKLYASLGDRLLKVDSTTGAVEFAIPLRRFQGHGMGAPVLLRIPLADGSGSIPCLFNLSGELVRLEDGHVYAKDIGHFQSPTVLGSNGIDIVYAQNKAFRPGEVKKAGPRRFFDVKEYKKAPHVAIRFALADRDTLKAEQLWSQKQGPGPAPIFTGKTIIGKEIFDLKTGANLSAAGHKRAPKLKYYYGLILANGALYGNTDNIPPQKSGKFLAQSARFTTTVNVLQADGVSWKTTTNELEEILDFDNPRAKEKIIAVTGRYQASQWYGWHSAYSTPFASGNRLFIRTYNYLWCIGNPDQAFTPSAAFTLD